MKYAKEISIIITTKDRVDRLTNLLSSLLEQTVIPGEIIIVDNSANQSAKRVVSLYKETVPTILRYLHVRKKGTPSALNSGIESARGKILGFLDDDCVAKKHWVEEIQNNFKKEVDILMGPSLNGIPGNIFAAVHYASVESQFFAERYVINSETFVRYLDTKNYAIRKSIFQKIGLFNPRLPNLFDLEFSYRLRDKNIKIYFGKKLIAVHFGRSTPRQFFSRFFELGRAFYSLNCLLIHKYSQQSDDSNVSKNFYLDIKKSKKKEENKYIKELLQNESFMWKYLFRFVYAFGSFTMTMGYFYEKVFEKIAFFIRDTYCRI